MSVLIIPNNPDSAITMRGTWFDGEITVDLEDGSTIDDGEAAGALLNNLGPELLASICEAAIRYCHAHQESVGRAKTEFADRNSVLEFIKPSGLFVVPTPESGNPIVHFEANCSWEAEHGMEVIIWEGKLVYLGSYLGYGPFADYEDKPWNFCHR